MAENIFADEWRECLQAHYIHVIRTNDRVTLPSLTIVMHQAGFSDTELAEFRVRATMHMDHVDEDFVPDLDALHVEEASEEAAFMIAVAEMPSAQLPEETLAEDELPAEPEPVMAEEESAVEEYVPNEPEDDPDMPQQLTLF